MSNAFLPRGSQFSRSPDGSTYTTMAEAKKVTFSIKGEFLDVSNMDSPTAYKEWLAGMIDGGSVKVEANFIASDATQTQLWADLAAQTKLFWKLELPATRGNLTWQGFVEELSPDFDTEKPAGNSVSIKVTGAMVWTPSA